MILPVTAIFRPVRLIAPVPVAERAEATVMQLLAMLATRARLPLAGRLMAAVTAILPVLLLPMVRRLAVILPISAEVNPRLAESSVPPRFTSAPSDWIRTLPAEVAFTVPVMFMLLAVRVIRPPLEYTFDPESKEVIPVKLLKLSDVLPVIITLPAPVAEMLADEFK